MGRRVDLPGGGWADIKDPEELSNRDRKLLRRSMLAARGLRDRLLAAGVKPGTLPGDRVDQAVIEAVDSAVDADDLDLADDAQAAMIVTYTSAWSLTLPDRCPRWRRSTTCPARFTMPWQWRRSV
jgi:hypothetical protein